MKRKKGQQQTLTLCAADWSSSEKCDTFLEHTSQP